MVKSYRFLEDNELSPSFLNDFSAGKIIDIQGELQTYKERDYAECVNLSTTKSPSGILFEVRGILPNTKEYGDSFVFKPNIRLKINKVDKIDLINREVIRLSLTPEQSEPSPEPSSEPSPEPSPEDQFNQSEREENKAIRRDEKVRRSQMKNIAQAGASILYGDPLLKELDKLPSSHDFGRPLTPTHPERYTFYKVDIKPNHETGELNMTWGHANPIDHLPYLPQPHGHKELHVLRTHDDVGKEVPKFVRDIIIAGINGTQENASKMSHAYVNLNPGERIQGYGFVPKDEKQEQKYLDQPLGVDKDLVPFYSDYITKLYIKGKKGLKTQKKKITNYPNDKEITDIRKNIIFHLYNHLGYDNARELTESRHERYDQIFDPLIKKTLKSSIDKPVKSLFPRKTNNKLGKWEQFENAGNTDKKVAREEATILQLSRKIPYNISTGEFSGPVKSRIHHILDFIRNADEHNNARYQQTRQQRIALERELNKLGAEPDVLTNTEKQQQLHELAKTYLSVKDQDQKLKRIRDSLNIFYVMCVANGIRAQTDKAKKDKEAEEENIVHPNIYEGPDKEPKRGAATLAYSNVRFGNKDSDPDKTYFRFIGKTGNKTQFYNYDPYLNKMLRRAKKEIEEQKIHEDNLGNVLLPEHVTNHLGQFFPTKALSFSPEHIKHRRLFEHLPGDFNRAVYHGWGDLSTKHSDLSRVVRSFGFKPPMHDKELPKINAQLLRKLNVNMRTALESELEGAKLYAQGVHTGKPIRLTEKALSMLENRVRGTVARDTGHSSEAAQSYILKRNIEEGIKRGRKNAKRYHLLHGELLTPFRYSQVHFGDSQ